MSTRLSTNIRNKEHEQAVIDYVKKRNGRFICVTHDARFAMLLRVSLSRGLGLAQSVLTVTADADLLLRHIRDSYMRCNMLLVFLERTVDGKDMSFLVRQIKNAYASLRVIILTGETEQQRLALLREAGADNVVSKPVSMVGLIEKIACTIKPQGRLGQLADLARVMLNQGNPKDALKVCKRILDVKSGFATGFLIAGDAFKALGKMERAREAYERASDNAQMYLDPLQRLAQWHAEAGDATKRLHYLERLDNLSPLNVSRKVDMGEIHVGLGNEETAEKLFEVAVKLAAKEAAGYIEDVAFRVAGIYAQKHPDRSEKYLRHALKAKGRFFDRNDVSTLNRLGIIMRGQGRWREALAEYQRAVQLAPDDEILHYNMGMACAEGRQFHDARRHMLKALALNPHLPRRAAPIAYNIALVFIQTGGTDKALEYLRAALEMEPGFVPAQKALKRLQAGA